MDILDWQELANSRKRVRDSDKYPCGNLIAEYKDNIIILEGDIKSHEYMVPKSKVGYYDGQEIYLDIPYSMLSDFNF